MIIIAFHYDQMFTKPSFHSLRVQDKWHVKFKNRYTFQTQTQ